MGQLSLTLTDPEREQFHACEQVIERGLKIFVEVGEALLTIRDSRLYREDHRTFEDYCRERWGFEHSHRARLIQAAEVVQELRDSPIGESSLPANEAQARELTPLREDPERMVGAWQEAVDTAPGGKITADHVRSVVQEYREPNPDPEPQPIEVWSSEEQELQARLQTGETIIVNFRSHENLIAWAQERDLFVRIDRQSVWGNPFELGKDGDRATVVGNYRDYYLPHKPSLIDRLDDLKGKALGCWCAPEICHGDVLATEVDGDS